MKNENKYYEYLDELLKIYCEAPDETRQAMMTRDLKQKIVLSDYHHLACYLKLFEDKYIEKLPKGMDVATLNGILFSGKGGYRKKRRNERIKNAAYIGNIIVLCIAAIVGIVLAVLQIINTIEPNQLPNEKSKQCQLRSDKA